MKITRKILGAVAAAGLAVTMTSCVNSSNTPQGAAPAGSADDDSVVIGIKINQPGLGQQVGTDYEGFDVDVAKYVADKLGYSNVTFKEAPSAQRETLISSNQVKMIFATYSITDERKQKVSFAGPYFVAGQDLLVKSDSTITGPDDLNGKKLCSVTGSTSAKKVQDEYAGKVQLQEYADYVTCVEALNAGRIDAVTTDDVILAGFAAQPQYQGKLKVVGKTFSEENYGVGIKKGDTELCGKINDALQSMIDDGAWAKALEDNVGPSGFEYNDTLNPPKFDTCS